jgi:hypothetical protein
MKKMISEDVTPQNYSESKAEKRRNSASDPWSASKKD